MRTLIASFALSLTTLCTIALPLSYSPSMTEIIERLEPEKKTFLCYCEFEPPYGKVDLDGCESTGSRSVIGNIITPRYLLEMLPFTPPPDALTDLMRAVTSDPLNITLFLDSTYPHYLNANTVTGTIEPQGQFGACRASIIDGLARIPDGRLGEFARTALYLIDMYGLPVIAEKKQHLFDIHLMSPVTERELARNIAAYRWNQSWNDYITEKPFSDEVTRDMQNGIMEFIYKYRIMGQ